MICSSSSFAPLFFSLSRLSHCQSQTISQPTIATSQPTAVCLSKTFFHKQIMARNPFISAGLIALRMMDDYKKMKDDRAPQTF